MSTPAEPSLFQNEVQILNAKPQVVHWTWWWQHLATWHCRSVLSLPCHSTADIGGLVLSMAISLAWSIALHTRAVHMATCLERGGVKTELVAAPWTSSRWFSHVLWLKVYSHLLLRASLLGGKRKLPLPACQVRLGLPSVVCHPRGMQFPGTVYICSQGPLSRIYTNVCTNFKILGAVLVPEKLKNFIREREKWTNKGNDKHQDADSVIYNTTSDTHCL